MGDCDTCNEYDDGYDSGHDEGYDDGYRDCKDQLFYLNTKDKMELEIKVAEILARQFWNGVESENSLREVGWDEYIKKSLHNWMYAARGVISLIKNKGE